MGWITVLFVSLFLSSASEARHGAYDYKHRYSPWDCGNCHIAGISFQPRIPTRGYFFAPPKKYQPTIWPSLPTKGIPYLQ